MKTILTCEDNRFQIVVSGRFTTDEATGFLKEIDTAMQAKNAEIVMELSELDFISSAGIRCFVMLLKACTANASTLRLKNLTPQLKDIFTMTALLDKFNVE